MKNEYKIHSGNIVRNGVPMGQEEIVAYLQQHELARQLSCDSPELNMSNYDEDDVSMLNQFGIEIHKALNI